MGAKRLSLIFVEAATGGISITRAELFECAELAALRHDPLAAIMFINQEAKDHDIEITPPLAQADTDTGLVLRRIDRSSAEAIGARVAATIQKGELVRVELKSTLWLHTKRQANDASATAEQLRSTDVCQSVMKTVCGFLNEEGGTLIIGIGPDFKVLGLEYEFFVTCPKDQSLDGWMQALRTAVIQFFYEPSEVLNQIQISIGAIDGKSIAVLNVAPRRKLSFCKCPKMENFQIYTRRGTSSEQVELTSVEQYVNTRTERLRKQ